MAWHPYFNPATANTRMDYDHPLNRPLFIALFKQAQVRALLPRPTVAAKRCSYLQQRLIFWRCDILMAVLTAKLHVQDLSVMF